jgi:lycopene cyclase domain-containing protein
MTYFTFLLRFVIIPIIILLAITLWDEKRGKQITGFKNGRAVWVVIGIHILLAVAYTTPWDNYLVATGVWYYNPNLVTGIVIGYVPIEEYTFFVVETILAGLWWWFLARRLNLPLPEGEGPGVKAGFVPNKLLIYVSTCILVFVWMISTYLFFFGETKWTYLSITLFWALPPIIFQLLFGADILWHYRKLVAATILPLGAYLSLMDIVALRDTTWNISKTQTTGILLFGSLPIEEALFFFITVTLVAFGITLWLSSISHQRVARLKETLRRFRR